MKDIIAACALGLFFLIVLLFSAGGVVAMFILGINQVLHGQLLVGFFILLWTTSVALFGIVMFTL